MMSKVTLLLILIFVISSFGLMLAVQAARSDEVCPQIWVVAASSIGNVVVADTSDFVDGQCKIERDTENGITVKVESTPAWLSLLVTYPLEVVCSDSAPCSIVFGLRNNSCTPMGFKVHYSDGASEGTTKIRRTKDRGAKPQDWTCENTTILVSYIASPRSNSALRMFAASVELQ